MRLIFLFALIFHIEVISKSIVCWKTDVGTKDECGHLRYTTQEKVESRLNKLGSKVVSVFRDNDGNYTIIWAENKKK